MIKDFENYLILKGYAVTTPAGNPSTVYDYIKRVEKVCEWEEITLSRLSQNIKSIIKEYDLGGSKEYLGKKSHKAVINALKRFSEFLNS